MKKYCTCFVTGICMVLLAPDAFANPAATPEPGLLQTREGSRYERLRALVSSEDPEIAFIGDSKTELWRSSGANVWSKYYGNRSAINLGVLPDKTQNILWRLQNDYLDKIEPKVYVVQAGNTNLPFNTNEEIVGGIEAIIDAISEAQPEAKVILMGVFPDVSVEEVDPDRISELNALIESIEWPEQVRFRNINDQLYDDSGNISGRAMVGGRELTQEGYEIWAQAIEEDIAEFLGE